MGINQGGQCRVNVHQGTENLARTAGLAMGQGHLQVIQGELHPSPPNRRRIYPPSGHSVSKRTSLQMSKSCRTCNRQSAEPSNSLTNSTPVSASLSQPRLLHCCSRFRNPLFECHIDNCGIHLTTCVCRGSTCRRIPHRS